MSLIMIKLCYHNIHFVHIFTLIGFLPQFFYNFTVTKFSKNKIHKIQVMFFTINRCALSLYIDAFPYNIFENKPIYSLGIASCIILVIQVFLIYLQGRFGAYFMIPNCLRKDYYNYYKSIDEIKDSRCELTCAICLNDLEYNSGSRLQNDKEMSYKEGEDDSKRIELNNNEIGMIKQKNLRCFSKTDNKKLLLTPCNHIFHVKCLISWSEFKNECPVCRGRLPLIY